MAHNVKCLWCGEVFDCEVEQAVKPRSNRYGHLKCMPEGENYELVPMPTAEELMERAKKKRTRKKSTKKPQKDQDLVQLETYIIKLFNVDYVPPRIQRQIKQYHEEYHYTYSGILKTLVYFFEVQNGSTEQYGNTIGIVPYVYDKARQYFYTVYMAQHLNKNLTKEQTKTKVVEYTIPAPKHRHKKIKLFTFEEDDVDE